jgi:hypothetical protein
MFYAKRESELLQSRLDSWSRSGSRLLNLVEKGLPARLGREARELRSQPLLQIHSKRTERGCRSKAGTTASFEGEIEFPGTFGHIPQTYLKGRFVESPNYIDVTRYSYASTLTR